MEEQDVNRLIRQFLAAQKMMKVIRKNRGEVWEGYLCEAKSPLATEAIFMKKL